MFEPLVTAVTVAFAPAEDPATTAIAAAAPNKADNLNETSDCKNA